MTSPGPSARTYREHCVAKKPNFGFEKRQKDLKKQWKREEKAEKKRRKKEGGGEQGEWSSQADGDSELSPGEDAETA